MPYSATEDQVREFFAGYEVNAVHFVYEPDGRPSGLVSTDHYSLLMNNLAWPCMLACIVIMLQLGIFSDAMTSYLPSYQSQGFAVFSSREDALKVRDRMLNNKSIMISSVLLLF